jgi:hypothetical protein
MKHLRSVKKIQELVVKTTSSRSLARPCAYVRVWHPFLVSPSTSKMLVTRCTAHGSSTRQGRGGGATNRATPSWQRSWSAITFRRPRSRPRYTTSGPDVQWGSAPSSVVIRSMENERLGHHQAPPSRIGPSRSNHLEHLRSARDLFDKHFILILDHYVK